MLFLILVTAELGRVKIFNMHNGRVNDVTYCYNLGKNVFLHIN